MKSGKEQLVLYGVTDRSLLKPDQSLVQAAEESLKGGVTCLQLREKNLGGKELLKEALELKRICGKYHVPLIINDNVSVALESDADGVHVGQDDMEAGLVRKAMGPSKILGVSVRTVEEALKAEQAGADYLGVGAVFPTGSKADASEVSLEMLQRICEAVNIPVVAIGGIGQRNVWMLEGRGIAGIAVISAVFGQEDIRQAAAELKVCTEAMLYGKGDTHI